jgi:hypothetical protein
MICITITCFFITWKIFICIITTIKYCIYIYWSHRNKTHGYILQHFHWPVNTLRTGHLNFLNLRSRALNTIIQLLYFVSLKIYNKFADD